MENDKARWKSRKVEKEMEGVASIALLSSGSISGHFIQLPHSLCYGLYGTGTPSSQPISGLRPLELACERECSRGEDYRLINLTITNFHTKKEQSVIVECKGHDAARFRSIDHAHGWEDEIVGMVEQKERKKKIMVSFDCETLKAEKAAEEHIKQFMPKLAGLDTVVNIGRMRISGLDFEADGEEGSREAEEGA